MARAQWTSSHKLIEAAYNVLSVEQPMTVRQCFYRLVSNGTLENNRAEYVKVSRILTKARKLEEIPFEWIVDRSRPSYSPSVYDDLAQGLRILRKYYRRDYWQDQPYHPEIWCEKDAVVGSIESVTDERGVAIHVCRGFTSTTRAHDIADRFTCCSNKPITVFYLGDHDPSGREIEKDITSRVKNYTDAAFEIRRLAIHQSDIQEYHLPPLRVKDSDSRSRQFKAEYGEDCVELDALPPDVLRQRIADAIDDLIDWEAWERAIVIESAERESITKIVTRMKRREAACEYSRTT